MSCISVFVIAQDEAGSIVRCLTSLGDLADEIVVIDGGSRDDTRSLASGCGARVVENAWPGFATQKNFGLAQCTSPWILTLDADEELSPALRAEIAALKPQLEMLWVNEGVGGWSMSRRVLYEGRWILHGDWNPDYVTRLFRREGACVAGGQVHERIEHQGRVRRLQAPLWHYSYRDRADHLARVRKYAALWAASAAARGRRSSALGPISRAAWRLLRGLVLRRGFLDGRLGWRIAWLGAYEVFLKYSLLREMRRGDKVATALPPPNGE